MTRTLEIEFYGTDCDFYIGQIPDLNVDINDIEGTQFHELVDKGYVQEEPQPTRSFLGGECFVGSVRIISDGNIELEEKIDLPIHETFKTKKCRNLYWGRKDKRNQDLQLVVLNKEQITYVGYWYNKSIWTARIENFEGAFDKDLVSAVINNPKEQDEFWPNWGEFLLSVYYGDKRAIMQWEHGDGKGCETIYWDKEWNKTIPALYLKNE